MIQERFKGRSTEVFYYPDRDIVLFKVPNEKVESAGFKDSLVEVSFEDVKEFVLDQIRKEYIKDLENASYDTFAKIFAAIESFRHIMER